MHSPPNAVCVSTDSGGKYLGLLVNAAPWLVTNFLCLPFGARQVAFSLVSVSFLPRKQMPVAAGSYTDESNESESKQLIYGL